MYHAVSFATCLCWSKESTKGGNGGVHGGRGGRIKHVVIIVTCENVTDAREQLQRHCKILDNETTCAFDTRHRLFVTHEFVVSETPHNEMNKWPTSLLSSSSLATKNLDSRSQSQQQNSDHSISETMKHLSETSKTATTTPLTTIAPTTQITSSALLNDIQIVAERRHPRPKMHTQNILQTLKIVSTPVYDGCARQACAKLRQIVTAATPWFSSNPHHPSSLSLSLSSSASSSSSYSSSSSSSSLVIVTTLLVSQMDLLVWFETLIDYMLPIATEDNICSELPSPQSSSSSSLLSAPSMPASSRDKSNQSTAATMSSLPSCSPPTNSSSTNSSSTNSSSTNSSSTNSSSTNSPSSNSPSSSINKMTSSNNNIPNQSKSSPLIRITKSSSAPPPPPNIVETIPNIRVPHKIGSTNLINNESNVTINTNNVHTVPMTSVTNEKNCTADSSFRSISIQPTMFLPTTTATLINTHHNTTDTQNCVNTPSTENLCARVTQNLAECAERFIEMEKQINVYDNSIDPRENTTKDI